MALPPIFPLYPDSLSGPYNVSLALPGPISQISKSIGLTSSAIMLFPNAEFIQKLIDGDLGIADAILKGMMSENFASPNLATDEMAFRKFAELNKIDLGNEDINKYKKDGKFVMPKDKITISPEWDKIGLKAIEKTTLQSIFETQKPYLEIAKLVIENIAKIEDIIARVMPLISLSPLTCKSKKPNLNGGKGNFPKAIGYNNGQALVDELSKLETILTANIEVKKKLDFETVNSFFSQDSTGKKASQAQKDLLSKWSVLIAALEAGDISMKSFSDIISANGGVESKYKPIIQQILSDTSKKFSVIRIYNLTQQISPVIVTFDDARDLIKPAIGKWTFKNNLDIPNRDFIRIYQDLSLQFYKEKVPFSMIPDEPTGNTGDSAPPAEDGKWQIISTIYSTGTFNPNIEYQYFYKDLPQDEPVIKPRKSELNLNEEKDPYHKYKPKKLILGIYNSKGEPLNPTQFVNTIGLSGNNVIDVPTPFKKADWILRSPKWYLPTGQYQWPDYGSPVFVWEKGSQTRESKTNPNADADPAWKIKKYKEGDKDIISKGDALPGNPVIVRFEMSEVVEYTDIFTDFVKFGFHKTDIKKSEKEALTKEIVGKLDIPAHLQNVFNYGQLRSSFYKRIGGQDPVPQLLKKSYKPYKIFSTKASVDQQIREFSVAKGEQPGFIWIEPEADYDMKLIRIDPTTNINYIEAQGESEVSTQIKNFVKNRFKFSFSNNIPFTISVTKNSETPEILTNITEYVVENWNYQNANAINDNQFEYTIWSSTPPSEYVNETGKVQKSTSEGTIFYELVKDGSNYYYRKFRFKVDLEDVAIQAFIAWLNPSLLYTIWAIYINDPDATYTFTVGVGDASITRTIELKKIFPYKVYENFPAGDIDLFYDFSSAIGDEALVRPVRIDSTGKITRWYYLKNRTFTGPDSKKSSTVTLDKGETNYLPTFGVERNFTINYSTKTKILNQDCDISFIDSDFTLYRIKVDSNNPFGSIIDPTKITNEQLTRREVYSLGKYGHGAPDEPQEIEILKRYKLTDLDTESYYVVEGILRNPPPGDPLDNVPQSASNVSDNSYYRLPDALGAIKVFISVLVDIFSKLVPQINQLISLFKNPTQFIVDIIGEKAGENILFLNKESLQTYSDGFKKLIDLKKIPNKPLPPEQIMLSSSAKYTTGVQLNGDRIEAIKELKKLFKNSNLSNYVFVDDEGKLTSILDGIAMIPFGIFGINLPFGIKLDTNAITEGKSPLSLIFPKDFKLKDVKDLTDALNLKRFDDRQPNIKDFQQPDPNLSDEFIVKFQDGSQRILPENSLDEFVIDNKTKYNFIYVEEDVQQTAEQIDKLIESGSQDDLQLAFDKLDKALKSKPNDGLLQDKFDRIKQLLEKLEIGQQPILKLLLGLITLPVKIIGGIIEWLLNFFLSLANPATLPQKMIELLSFQWVMQFFTPKGLLEIAGIRFKPEKKIEWAAQVMIPGPGKGVLPRSLKLPEDIVNLGYNKNKLKSDNYLSGDDMKIIDLSLFLNVIFNVKYPTYSPLQLRQNLKLPGPLLSGFLCLIEKIINAIIDFVWSTLGIEAIIPAPHIKLCDKDKNQPENASKLVNGQNNADLEEFYYEVKLEDGQVINFLDREELDKFISDNIDLNYDFNF
jgi:hypothetical protein